MTDAGSHPISRRGRAARSGRPRRRVPRTNAVDVGWSGWPRPSRTTAALSPASTRRAQRTNPWRSRCSRTRRAFCSGVETTVSSVISGFSGASYGSSMPVNAVIAPRADIQWGIHEDLDEAVLPDHVTHLVACRTVRTHRGGHHYSAVPDDLRSDEADAPDIGVPILFAEPQALPAAPSPRGPTRRPPPRS